MKPLSWQVFPKENGIRLVYFLQKKAGESFSARFWKRVVEKNLCKVNGKRERFGSTLLKTNDTVELEKNWQNVMKEKDQASCLILYEDEWIVVLNKEASVVCEDKNFSPLLLTHRLDKDTSGILILAKTPEVKEKMGALFAERAILKTYLAVVEGKVEKEEGICKSLLARKRSYQGGVIWGSSHRGLEAITEWECLQREQKTSLLLCTPKTGRTHQIRVHMAEMGHPIIGDYQYGRKGAHYVKRHLLHAWKVEFLHPVSSERMSLKAPIPESSFAAFLQEEVRPLLELLPQR